MDISNYEQVKSHTRCLDMAKKGHLKRETESLQIAAQNNAIRTNYVKAKIDKTQQNSKFWLHIDRDEMINLIISKCSELVQKEFDQAQLDGEDDPLGIVEEIEI